MTKATLIGCLAGWALLIPNACPAQQDLDSWTAEAIQTIAGRVQDSVARIETAGGTVPEPGAAMTGQAFTGTFAGPPGCLLTATANLAHEPELILVRLPDGSRVQAEIAGRNRSRQVTMLRLDTPAPPRPLVPAANVTVGQTAIAVGKVFDAAVPNLSAGIVSATGRIGGRVIQTDASVSALNYGGPLVDLEGNVLGILVPMSPASDQAGAGTSWYDSGVGFAVPLDELRLEQMASGQRLCPGLLGATFREDNGFASVPRIATVDGNSPASRAGLVAGDLIRSVNGQPVELLVQVRQRMGPLYAGDPVQFVIDREGTLLERELVLTDQIETWQHAMLGVLPENEMAEASGVGLRYVAPESPAANAGLQVADRILAVNSVPVPDRDALMDQLAVWTVGTSVELEVQRDQSRQTFTATLSSAMAEPWPNQRAGASPADGNRPLRRIVVAENSSASWACFPTAEPFLGLLVWLTPTENVDTQQELRRWQGWCDQYRMALLLVPPAGPDGWHPDEIARINGSVQQLLGDYHLDRKRIAIGGSGAAGQLASIAALQSPALYRGLILVDSQPDPRVRDVTTTPVFRQLVLLLQSTDGEEQSGPATSADEDLAARGFPGWSQTLPADAIPGLVIRWLDTLDRF